MVSPKEIPTSDVNDHQRELTGLISCMTDAVACWSSSHRKRLGGAAVFHSPELLYLKGLSAWKLFILLHPQSAHINQPHVSHLTPYLHWILTRWRVEISTCLASSNLLRLLICLLQIKLPFTSTARLEMKLLQASPFFILGATRRTSHTELGHFCGSSADDTKQPRASFVNISTSSRLESRSFYNELFSLQTFPNKIIQYHRGCFCSAFKEARAYQSRTFIRR